MIYVRYIKSLMDFLVALMLLVCISPLFVLLFLVLGLTQRGNIIFSQLRSGRNLQKFKLYKFRTLLNAPKDSLSMCGKKYTKMGKFMRRSGFDELPQLINILKGEMSFVGPRPLPVEYENRYSEAHLIRFELRPGLTGWAQVNGRNETSWERRFKLDRWYIDHVSILVDLTVLLKTLLLIIKTIFAKGKEEITMDVFKGTRLI